MSTDNSQWQSIVSRDKAADGTFFYAVRSTGVYCRPSCPARRPRLENVQFFADHDSAETAGYRACKRCNPRGDEQVGRAQFIARAICDYVESADHWPSLEELAQHAHLSPYHLQRTFKQVMGVTPKMYAEGVRQRRLREQLRTGKTVTSAIFDAGYESSSSVYQRAGSQLGMTPAEYKRGRGKLTVRFAVGRCQLGSLAVAATEKGICRVLLDDSDQAAIASLRAEYPAAEHADDEVLTAALNSIARFLAGDYVELDLPLDIKATAFQCRVWDALRAIPYGQTRSYKQIAEQLGQPAAARAVARACATNPVALVIPCHRVLREGGDLAGYRWGIKRKEALLAMEASMKSLCRRP